jgi:hypothetical protein
MQILGMIVKGIKNIYNKKMSNLTSRTVTAGDPQNNRLKDQLTHLISTLSRSPYLVFFLTVLPIMIIYLPALGIYLRTDDFEWLNESYSAWKHPLVFFKLIGGFFRPIVKLSYLLNYSLFGKAAVFYSIVTILIHISNLFLVYLLILKQTSKVFPAAAVAFFFGISSYYSEITLWAAARPDSLMLFFVLLLLLFISQEQFKSGWKSHAIILFLGLGAVGSKEAWVLFPFLVFFYLVLVKRLTLKNAFSRIWVFFFLLFLYFLFPLLKLQITGVQGIFNYSQINVKSMLVKTGFLIFKFIGLSNFYTGSVLQFSVAIASGLLIFLLVLIRKNWLALWGLLWVGCAMVQVLIINYLPSRYNYLPLLGFWIAVVAFLSAEMQYIFKLVNKAIVCLAVIVAILFYGVYHSVMLQWDIRDYHSNGLDHLQLVRMFEQINPKIPRHLPFFIVNMGQKKSVWEFSRSVRGQNKILFVRGDAFWQLIHPAQLANFCGNPFSEKATIVPKDQLASAIDREFTVLVFTNQGFVIANHLRKEIRDYFKKTETLPKRTWMLTYQPT